MIRSIPRPSSYESSSTISNMKSIVDKQELRIQLNMMEIEELENKFKDDMARKITNYSQENSMSDNSSENEDYWGQNSKNDNSNFA